ncbi:hypothetical protein [Brevundimonas diminuta]|uniref:hypothetical protein n=1 Tax=Brevundimonas diminuta TaxID=293 RepID=UPI001177BCF7|nr:hypothetical protein [Brevundimonas diminuta]
MTSLTQNRRLVKRRLDHLLWHSQTERSEALRHTLRQHFASFENIAIVGGMVRDVARQGGANFCSDVDIVIDAPADEVANLAKKLSAQPNRFGGFGADTPGWKVDFWALETTWALKAGHTSINSLEDVTKATFFDTDSVIYNIWNRTIHCSDGYFELLTQNSIDINLEPNPSPTGNLLRALRRLNAWKAKPGEKLINFIAQHLTDENLVEMKKIENRIYKVSYLNEFSRASELEYRILIDNYCQYAPLSHPRQRDFFHFWPPPSHR